MHSYLLTNWLSVYCLYIPPYFHHLHSSSSHTLLASFKNQSHLRRERVARSTMEGGRGGRNVVTRELFKKALTATDISQHHERFLVKTADAEEHFPRLIRHFDSDGDVISCEPMMLRFLEMNENRPWNFKYTFWRSCKSYVLTKHWKEFAKFYALQEKDTIKFNECVETRGEERQAYFTFEIIRKQEKSAENVEAVKVVKKRKKSSDVETTTCDDHCNQKVIKLFGVFIRACEG